MALAAAHYQTGGLPDERDVLLLLEEQPPPSIYAGESSIRPSVTHFVPVNDRGGLTSKAPLSTAPGLARERQPRTFARAWIPDEIVFLAWPDSKLAPKQLTTLALLCRKVTRVGHSQSLVQMWIEEMLPEGLPAWQPDEVTPTTHLRIAGPGLMEYLDQAFNKAAIEDFWGLEEATVIPDPEPTGNKKADRAAKEKASEFRDAARAKLAETFSDSKVPPRLWPDQSLWHGYSRPPEAEKVYAPGTVFDPSLLILQLTRRNSSYRALDAATTLAVARQLRDALHGLCGTAAPELLTGHRADGAAADRPHIAFLPLLFTGQAYADGRVMGMALAFPHITNSGDRRTVLRALAVLQKNGLVLGRLGEWDIARPESPGATLQSNSWTANPAGRKEWATVTPFVFDKHAKAKDLAAYREEIAASIRLACERAGVRVPVRVVVTPTSAHLGIPAAHAFPRLQRKDGSERRHCHAILEFDEPIIGPLVLGAGRYLGYGLCRPVDSEI
jgi:CRISPR-associated protein Csb2